MSGGVQLVLDESINDSSHLKQKKPKSAGSSFLHVRICGLSLLFMILNEESWVFGLLVEQKNEISRSTLFEQFDSIQSGYRREP